jgi:nitrate/nitrite transporter NarK
MTAIFMTAIPLAGVFGGPVSGWIMQTMGDVAGLANWQWLYLLEGVPSVVIGLLVLSLLDDRPQSAHWLSDEEKALLVKNLDDDEVLKRSEGNVDHRFGDAFRSRKVWLLCVVYFGFIMGTYGISFWLPQIIEDTITRNVWEIGFLSAIPWAVASVAMVLNGQHSDKTRERRWHIAVPALVGALAFAGSGLPGISGWVGLAFLTFATAGTMAALSTFWSLPTSMLSGTAAAAGIAWINSIGNLAGYVSPLIVGKIRDTTNDMTLALLVLSFAMLFSTAVLLFITRLAKNSAE